MTTLANGTKVEVDCRTTGTSAKRLQHLGPPLRGKLIPARQ
ncbi:hypothetical protein [Streptomyces sp. NPDC092903]